MKKRICKKCGREYAGEPGLSRENWLIMICPDCKREEDENAEQSNFDGAADA